MGTKLDFCFSIEGGILPRDHGYTLLGAISRLIPDVHYDKEIGIFPINGKRKNGFIQINPFSVVRLRAPASFLEKARLLENRCLNVGGKKVYLKSLKTFNIKPFNTLASRCVVVKLLSFSGSKEKDIPKMIENINISIRKICKTGEASIPVHYSHSFVTVRTKQWSFCGIPILVNNLKDDDSIILQTNGIGGKRHMGCGLFYPVNECN